MGTCCLTSIIMGIFLGIYAFNNPDVNPKKIYGEIDNPLSSNFGVFEGYYYTFECFVMSYENGAVFDDSNYFI